MQLFHHQWREISSSWFFPPCASHTHQHPAAHLWRCSSDLHLTSIFQETQHRFSHSCAQGWGWPRPGEPHFVILVPLMGISDFPDTGVLVTPVGFSEDGLRASHQLCSADWKCEPPALMCCPISLFSLLHPHLYFSLQLSSCSARYISIPTEFSAWNESSTGDFPTTEASFAPQITFSNYSHGEKSRCFIEP